MMGYANTLGLGFRALSSSGAYDEISNLYSVWGFELCDQVRAKMEVSASSDGRSQCLT